MTEGLVDRLEAARVASGHGSLRSFHRALVADGWGGGYDAARTYHNGREPSASYFFHASRVSGLSLYWLISGEDPPDDAPKVAVASIAKWLRDRASEIEGIA